MSVHYQPWISLYVSEQMQETKGSTLQEIRRLRYDGLLVWYTCQSLKR